MKNKKKNDFLGEASDAGKIAFEIFFRKGAHTYVPYAWLIWSMIVIVIGYYSKISVFNDLSLNVGIGIGIFLLQWFLMALFLFVFFNKNQSGL